MLFPNDSLMVQACSDFLLSAKILDFSRVHIDHLGRFYYLKYVRCAGGIKNYKLDVFWMNKQAYSKHNKAIQKTNNCPFPDRKNTNNNIS